LLGVSRHALRLPPQAPNSLPINDMHVAAATLTKTRAGKTGFDRKTGDRLETRFLQAPRLVNFAQ
jgi:hypothetical protein